MRAPDLRKLVTASGHAKVGRRCDREENRIMRRLFVALLVVALALTLVACGGGSETSDSGGTGSSGGGASSPPPPPAAVSADTLVPDRSPTETVSYTAISSQSSALPAEVQKRLSKKQPVLLYLFDKTQKSSSETRAEVDAAMKSYRGLIDLVAYDVSRYVTTDSDTGAVTVSPKLSADKEASKVITMLEQMKVNSTPTIIIVDANGTVLWRSRGYTDRQLIEKEILRATD